MSGGASQRKEGKRRLSVSAAEGNSSQAQQPAKAAKSASQQLVLFTGGN